MGHPACKPNGSAFCKPKDHCILQAKRPLHFASQKTIVFCKMGGDAFSAQEIIFGLVLKEIHYVVKSMRNLDVKCKVQIGPCTFCR